MDESPERSVYALQGPQQLHSQHRDSNRANEKCDHKQDDSILHRYCQHHQYSEYREYRAGKFEYKCGAGDQTGADPDQQGDRQRDRRG